MQISHRLALTGAAALGAAGTAAAPAAAQTLNLSVAIPRLSVAEYHRPYVAIWIEKEGAAPRTLSVWAVRSASPPTASPALPARRATRRSPSPPARGHWARSALATIH
jgi:hypothetical protein